MLRRNSRKLALFQIEGNDNNNLKNSKDNCDASSQMRSLKT